MRLLIWRALFWITALLFALTTYLAVGLFVTEPPSGGGMVMIYFLPLCGLAIVAGVANFLVKKFGGETLKGFERRVGQGITVVLVVGICALGIVMALE